MDFGWCGVSGGSVSVVTNVPLWSGVIGNGGDCIWGGRGVVIRNLCDFSSVLCEPKMALKKIPIKHFF